MLQADGGSIGTGGGRIGVVGSRQRRQVSGIGSQDARLVLLGEAPGASEEQALRPFIGPAGHRLDEFLRQAGLDRSALRIENVCEIRPPGNKLERLPAGELDHWKRDAQRRIQELRQPQIIVPMGNVALETLLGKAVGRERTDGKQAPGILRHSGSRYDYVDGLGRTLAVMPVPHPAATLRTGIWQKRSHRYWRRIAAEYIGHPEPKLSREYFTRPTLDDLKWFRAEARQADALAIDIETPRRVTWQDKGLRKDGTPKKPKRVLGKPYIGCVGFATSATFGICIPSSIEYWGTADRLARAWEGINDLCQLPCEKVLQYGQFDNWHLMRERGVRLRNWRLDTLALHHLLDPADDHDLAYLCSYYTNHGYYKDECKDPDSIAKYASSIDALFTYNVMDCVVTYEVADQLAAEVYTKGLWSQYVRDYRNLFQPFLDTMLTGVRVDTVKAGELRAELRAKIAGRREAITEAAGVDLYGAKTISNKKLSTYLYETLKLPKQMVKDAKSGERRVTVREVAVRKLLIKYPDKLGAVGKHILAQRRDAQVLTFVGEKRVDDDGRAYSSYSFAPETGRLSSSTAPNGTGMNAQNQDHEIQSIFIADPGYVCLSLDKSQGESRIVDLLTGDLTLWDRAFAKPWDRDAHRENAARIFLKPLDQVTKADRTLGKRFKHAGNYDMHGKKMAEELLKDGYVFSDAECQMFIERGVEQPIRDWQRRTRQVVLRDRKLTNPFGFTLNFQWERFNDDLYRRAYAAIPQGTLAKIVNVYGWQRSHQWIKQCLPPGAAWVSMNGHDSLKFMVKPAYAYELLVNAKQFMEAEVVYDTPRGKQGMVIPVEVSLGLSWAGGQDWKQTPGELEFNAAVGQLMEVNQ